LQEIRAVLEPLSRKVEGVKWVDPGQAHLTLHFFGATLPKEISKIDDAMKRIAPLFAPLKVCLDRVGAFPDLHRPDVIWLGIREKSGVLSGFCQTVQREIKHLGFELDPRPLHPHVTLGRVKKHGGDLEAVLPKVTAGLPTAEKSVDHFILYESHCLPEGAHYEPLKTYAFTKSV